MVTGGSATDVVVDVIGLVIDGGGLRTVVAVEDVDVVDERELSVSGAVAEGGDVGRGTLEDAESSPEPPLGRNQDWVDVTLDLGDGPRTYRRDTNTMPNWAGSCWYYLNYLDPTRRDVVVDPALEAYWMGPGHNAQTAQKTVEKPDHRSAAAE